MRKRAALTALTVLAGAAISIGITSPALAQPTAQTTDTRGPVLVSAALTPDHVNIYDGAKSVTLTARVSDETGLDGDTLSWMVPTGSSGGMATSPMTATRIAGSATDGIYSGSWQVPADGAIGVWGVKLDHICDAIGYCTYYGYLHASGYPEFEGFGLTVTKNAAVIAPATPTATTTPSLIPSASPSVSPSASPSPSASASPSASPSPSTSPSPTAASPTPGPASSSPAPSVSPAPPARTPDIRPQLSLSSTTINAGQRTTVTYNGEPGTTLTLQSRTQPATDFSTIASVVLDSAGRGITSHAPSRNTRIRVLTRDGQTSNEPLISVRSVASLNARRTNGRTYTLTGKIYPALTGRLVSIYRNGTLTGQARTNSAGIYCQAPGLMDTIKPRRTSDGGTTEVPGRAA